MYSGLDDPERRVLPAVLAEQAARRPQATWIETVDGASMRFGEAHADAAPSPSTARCRRPGTSPA